MVTVEVLEKKRVVKTLQYDGKIIYDSPLVGSGDEEVDLGELKAYMAERVEIANQRGTTIRLVLIET